MKIASGWMIPRKAPNKATLETTMNPSIPKTNQRGLRRAPRRLPLPMAVLAVALALTPSQQAPAQWAVVEVGLNTVNSTLTEVNTVTTQLQAAAEYVENKTRWLATLQEWKDRLSQFQQIIASPLMPSGINLQPVALDWNVAERCGIGSAFSISGIMSALNLNFSGDIGKQQKDICIAMQILENQRYNETVKIVRETMPDMMGILDKIKQIRLLTKKPGGVTESTDNTLQSMAQMESKFKVWENQIKTYDMQISSLQRQQQLLTQRALKGEKSPIGSLVKTGALKAALEL